jgi:hypothetical protein
VHIGSMLFIVFLSLLMMVFVVTLWGWFSVSIFGFSILGFLSSLMVVLDIRVILCYPMVYVFV